MVGNSGRYSKFKQRLRNIYLNWLRKKRKKKTSQEEFVNEKVQEIRREVNRTNLNIPKKVGINEKKISIVKNDKRYDQKIVSIVNKPTNDKVVVAEQKISLNNNFYKKSIVNELKEKREFLAEKPISNTISKDDKVDNNVHDEIPKKVGIASSYIAFANKKRIVGNEKDISFLKVDIINKLKKKFIDKEAELEVLESELFFINEAIDNSVSRKEVKELRKKIHEIVDKINEIIDQYNLYNRSYDMSNIIDLDDECIVDDIINYRGLLENYGDKKNFVKEYKLLDEFKSLYSKLEVIKVSTKKVDERNEETIKKYNIRDKKYDQVKLKLVELNGVNKDCIEEINKQNEYLNNLMKKLMTIDKEEYVTNKLVGLNGLLSQGLKFLALRLLSPLSGFIPNIARETLITKNAIKNMYKGLHYEEVRHVYYSAIDFNSELNNKLTDINYTENLIGDTLNDIKRLKEDFLFIYDSKVPGYDDTLKKIEKMEESIYKNQYKVEFVKKRLMSSKKMNEDKMIKVRKLNENRS